MSIKSIDFQLAAKQTQGISGVEVCRDSLVMIACLCVPVTLNADGVVCMDLNEGTRVCSKG